MDMTMLLGKHYVLIMKYIKHTVDLISGFNWLVIIVVNEKRDIF